MVPGTIPAAPSNDTSGPFASLYAAVIVKQVDQQTRAKTSLNELLREAPER